MAFVFHLDGVNESIKGELAGFEVQQLLSSQQKRVVVGRQLCLSALNIDFVEKSAKPLGA